jgi:hypothetical protein
MSYSLEVRTVPVCCLNLDPIRRQSLRSISNKFLINSTKLKFTYLPTEHDCDLVSKQITSTKTKINCNSI